MDEQELITHCKNTMPAHDLITLYGNTEESDLPLILVVGREPNNSGVFNSSVGTYNFDNSPKCAFWNISYGTVAKLNQPTGQTGQTLKQACRLSSLSPIAFTDILPLAIDNSNPNKDTLRCGVPNLWIDQHIDNMNGLNDIMDRAAAVILTGHETGAISDAAREKFTYGADRLEQCLDARNIPHLRVPFMFGNNQSEILDTIKAYPMMHQVISDTYQGFISQVYTHLDSTG